MPTTGYDQDAERINRGRSPWWHKWLFLGIAVGTAAVTALVVRYVTL